MIDRLVDEQGNALTPVLPGMGDIGDRLFGTGGEAMPIGDDDNGSGSDMRAEA